MAEPTTAETGTEQLVRTLPAQGRYYLSVSLQLAAYRCADVAGDDLDPIPGNNTTFEDTTVETQADWYVYLPLIVRDCR
jgi:hypothetical protein